jgi:hypothetical protein
MSTTKLVCCVVAAIGLTITLGKTFGEETGAQAVSLRDVAEFDAIADPVERSKALFVEAGRVIQHPRCLNCHPTDAHPRQGDDLSLHLPPVVRGASGHGTAPMLCSTCHQTENVDYARLPGHPNWHLAPIEMGWIGESLHAICEQLKDEGRNGGMDLEALHEHMAHDSLVGWAWAPGRGRDPAPGTQAAFGRLIRAWIDDGAVCPDGEAGAATGPVAPAGAACSGCHSQAAPTTFQ